MKPFVALAPARRSDLAVALFWALASALGTLAVLPYLFASRPALAARIQMPLPAFAAAQALQAAVLIFILALLGLSGRARTGLDSHLVRTWLGGGGFSPDFSKRCAICVGLGLAAGLVIMAAARGFDFFMPAPHAALTEVALWKRLVASIYGGVTEECLLRLFVMSGVIWLSLKIARWQARSAPAWIYGLGIVIAAVLFGAGHLPMAAAIWPLTPLVVGKILCLNGIGGVLFGWLYWRWSFEYAVIAHFCADLMLHGLSSS